MEHLDDFRVVKDFGGGKVGEMRVDHQMFDQATDAGAKFVNSGDFGRRDGGIKVADKNLGVGKRANT